MPTLCIVAKLAISIGKAITVNKHRRLPPLPVKRIASYAEQLHFFSTKKKESQGRPLCLSQTLSILYELLLIPTLNSVEYVFELKTRKSYKYNGVSVGVVTCGLTLLVLV